MSTSDSTPRIETFGITINSDGKGWQAIAIVSWETAEQMLADATVPMIAENLRTGMKHHNSLAVTLQRYGFIPASGAERGEAGFASLAVVSTLTAVLVLLLVVLPLLSSTIAGVRAASGGSL